MAKRVLLFLAQGFEELEAAAFTDVFGWSRSDGLEPVGLTICGLRAQVKATWNLLVVPEMQLADVNIDDFDALAIPGGFEEAGYYEDAYHPQFQETIRQFNAAGKTIASICVGALPMGKSGVLCGKSATTYSLPGSIRLQQLAEFGANTIKEPIVEDGNLITSCGPSTAIDVAFRLLEKLSDRENCDQVRKAMGF
jgi:4-methyl-5(b-hydroxyethyl)-thiazole monophosphate biosynthesis